MKNDSKKIIRSIRKAPNHAGAFRFHNGIKRFDFSLTEAER